MARRELRVAYSSRVMAAPGAIVTRRCQANVMQHRLGFFKRALDHESRAELRAVLEDCGRERVPLVVLLTLFGHPMRWCGVAYRADQTYVQPHPVELMLRKHVWAR